MKFQFVFDRGKSGSVSRRKDPVDAAARQSLR